MLKEMKTMAKRVSRVIKKIEAPSLLSKYDVMVLMYMKDHELHCDPPEGMTFGQFSTVCENLEDLGYIREAKKDDIIFSLNEPTYYHITPSGYEATVGIERETKSRNAEETKRKEAIISVDELNSLFANVVKKHAYYSNRKWQPTFWEEAMEYLLRLFDSERPAMHIYSIANELSALKTNSFKWAGQGEVFDGNRIAFQMYLIIYYEYRDHPVYKTMLGALLPVIGVLSYNNRIVALHSALDQAIKTRELIMAAAQQEKTDKTKQTQVEVSVPLEEKTNANIEEIDADAEEDLGDGASGYPLKMRIELLNHLLARAGFPLARISEKKLKTTLCKLYHIILGEGADSLLKPCIGKVVYKKKPEDLDKKVKEINSLLAKIDEEWKIKL